MKKLIIALLVLLLSLAMAIPAMAAGTPPWWDNPNGLFTSWRQGHTEGQLSNTGNQTQYIQVVFDVPNECPAEARSKEVWQQIEWTINSGTASLGTEASGRVIAWGTAACPASTSDPYSDDDAGFMKEKGPFTPTHGYANGTERGFTITDSNDGWRPQCERITTTFQVDPASSLDYRIEVQTVCKSPTAVTLSGLQATRVSAGERLIAMLQSWLQR